MKARLMLGCLPLFLLAGGCGGGWSGPRAVVANEAEVSPSGWRKFLADGNLAPLVERALAENHDLRSAMARIDSARARMDAARGALRPTVGAEVSAVRSRSGRNIDDDYSDSGRNVFAGLRASWEIDLWGKLRSEKGAALNRLLASGEAARVVRTNLIAEVASAYYELKALDTTLAVLARNEKLQEDAIVSVKAQVEAGKETQLAVRQFEAQLKNIQALRIEAERGIAEHEAAINLLCGRGPGKVPRGSGSIESSRIPLLASKVPSSFVEGRPDVMQAKFELEAAKGDVVAAKAAFYPGVTIDGMLGLQAFRAGKLLDSRSAAHSAGGGLVAPLLNRSALKAEFAEADAAQLEALHAYRQALVNGYVEVHNQVADGRLLERLERTKSEESALLVGAVETSGDLFQSGRATYLEVLTARQSALEAELERIEVRKMRLQAALGLYRAVGGG